MTNRLVKRRLIFIIGTLIAGYALAHFFLFTTTGGSLVVKWAISKYSKATSVEFQKAEGSIARNITLEDIRIKGIPGLPQDSQADIQKAEIGFNSLKLFNGRLSLPASEPILFHGDYAAGSLNFNVYSKMAGIGSLAALFNRQKSLGPLKGNLLDADIYLKGPVRQPVLHGAALVEELRHGDFSLKDAPLTCDFILKNVKKPLVNGVMVVEKGRVSGPATAIVKLNESKLFFSGDPLKPGLDIHGESTVENIKIRIVLKGTLEEPDLRLSSEPPLPQEQLLVMLATGKKWSGIDTALSKGTIPADLAIDFVDYFVFGGAGSKLSEKFGITGLSVTVDDTQKGIALKKSVSDKAEVGYGISQAQNKENAPEVTQKLSGELKVTDTISVGAEKELKQSAAPGNSTEEQKTDDKVTVKYKTSF